MWNNFWIWLLAVPIIVILVGVGILWYYVSWYESFRSEERNSLIRYDALNAAVLDKLPVPPSAKQIIKGSGGIISPTNVHGRILVVEMATTNATYHDLSSFYEKNLLSSGWQKHDSNFSFAQLFVRDKSCVRFTIPHEDVSQYMIQIWHSFLGWEFSPNLPPLWLLNIRDYGETDLLTCPR